jgi:hypothetical protein
VRFENQEMFSSTLKNAIACYNIGVVVVISEVAGVAPDCQPSLLDALRRNLAFLIRLQKTGQFCKFVAVDIPKLFGDKFFATAMNKFSS